MILNDSSALPSVLRFVAGISTAFSAFPLLPGLHTKVPTTAQTGPGVPLKFPPFNTKPDFEGVFAVV